MRGTERGLEVFFRVLGLAGVDPSENEEAHIWGKLFSWPMLLLAFWLIVQWYLLDRHLMSSKLADVLSWVVWFAFVAETVVITIVVDRKKHYLATNWMNLFIIASAFPVLWSATPMTAMLRALRLLLIPKMVLRWWHH